MVRFGTTSPGTPWPSRNTAYTAPPSRTLTQYAGISRTSRDTPNSPGPRPHALIRITKPLIMKNRSTPR
ncbi:hypothetical protein LUX57_42300 [Actinomadura madurae]|nr:hypothetical protein [Actinomadura madurae]MCP9970976.1 hypothetical protein [Actinomadura madurae]